MVMRFAVSALRVRTPDGAALPFGNSFVSKSCKIVLKEERRRNIEQLESKLKSTTKLLQIEIEDRSSNADDNCYRRIHNLQKKQQQIAQVKTIEDIPDNWQVFPDEEEINIITISKLV